MQISHTLELSDGKYRCQACKTELGEQAENWKNQANLEESAPAELGAPYTTGKKLLLRQFSCPGCGVLLDSELALPGDPFLLDRINQTGS